MAGKHAVTSPEVSETRVPGHEVRDATVLAGDVPRPHGVRWGGMTGTTMEEGGTVETCHQIGILHVVREVIEELTDLEIMEQDTR